MFVQVIEGPIADRDRFRQQYERWHEDLAPHADGWLGSTAGVTPDGVGFLAARFMSAEAAEKNSQRPEQGEWWSQTRPCFSADPEFHDCADVTEIMGGGSDDAGFVQVIRGRINDLARAREMLGEMEDGIAESRPDILGGYVAGPGDDSFVQVMYFRTEEAAREGERSEPNEAEARFDEEFQRLLSEPPRFLDLSDPWLRSA